MFPRTETFVFANNPQLSNTECSQLLGKMWKEVPSETKQQYKQKAQQLQEEFKRQHPNYIYRKARRKRALNELLTKSGNIYPGGIPSYPIGTMEPIVPQGLYFSAGYPGTQLQPTVAPVSAPLPESALGTPKPDPQAQQIPAATPNQVFGTQFTPQQ